MYDRNDKDCYINRSLNPYYTKSDFVGYISCSSRYIMIESSNYCDNYYSNDGIRYFHCYKSVRNCKECTNSNKYTKCNSGFYLVNNNSFKTLTSLKRDQYITLDGMATYN